MNMKVLSVVFSILFTSSAIATPINMACVTEYPTTSFVGLTEGDTISFRLIHHNGVKYMPIWSSVVTPNDLSVLKDVANVLTDLGDVLEFQMPEKNCQVLDGMLINCFGSTPAVEINGHQVSLWAVSTKEMVENSFAGTYASVWTSMALDIDGKSYHIPMKYSDSECFKDINPGNILNRLKANNVFLK